MDLVVDIKASQDDGKKRRSFLPAPKKASVLPLTPPQAPFKDEVLFSKSSALPLASAFYSTEASPVSSISSRSSSSSAIREQSRVQPYRLHPTERQTEERAFGTGLFVGARIKIGGIKPGILRYLGTTHLAPGIFCGIELFDPDGNHDGEVNGHRYFTCSPNHGIFAPKEKVCLDTSSALGRLESDSDVSYSSTESLSEKTQRAFRGYEEGRLRAVDLSNLSPALNPYSLHYTGDTTYSRHSRDSRYPGNASQPSPYSIGSGRSAQPLELHDYLEHSNKTSKSGLPRATKSSESAVSLQSKLPAASRTNNKYSDDSLLFQRFLSYSSQSELPLTSSLATATKNYDSVSYFDSDQEQERSSAKYRNHGARSSDGSEEDGSMRNTLSTGITKQLHTDSRQYMNFTFDPEELNRSLDPESSESDNSCKGKDFSVMPNNNMNIVYSNLRSRHDAHRDLSSDDSDFSPARFSNLYPPENFQRVHTGALVLRDDVQQPTSTPATVCSETFDASKSDSYTLFRTSIKQRLDTQAPGSETDKDDANLSSVSNSCLPQEIVPRVEDVGDNGLSASFHTCDGERIFKGGYVIKRRGDGKGGGVKISQTFENCTSESYMVSCNQSNGDLNHFQSYNICPGDAGVKRDRSSRDRSGNAMTSQNDQISKYGSVVLSPSRKCRNMSTGSSANGDSFSSGTVPKTDSSGESRGDNLDDSSTRASPEVSQTLEWDYEQEFNGKTSLGHEDSAMTASTSTGTSESLSDALTDVSEQDDGLLEGETPSSLMGYSDQFEATDNEFENIDSLEEFPIFGKDSRTVMTKSGISDKASNYTKSSSSIIYRTSSEEYSREDDTSSRTIIRAISSDSSQETLAAECMVDTPGSVEDKDFVSDDMGTTFHTGDSESFEDINSNLPGPVVSMEDVDAMKDKKHISEDMNDDREFSEVIKFAAASNRSIGGKKVTRHIGVHVNTYKRKVKGPCNRERPLSLLSTTSTDTGYVPEIDADLNALTTNSAGADWIDRSGVSHPTTHELPSGTELDAGDNQRGQPAAGILCPAGLKTKNDDDYGSDLTGNTEDDRIEADQVDGHDSSISRGAAVNDSMKVHTSRAGGGANDAGHSQEDDSVDPNTRADSSCAIDNENDNKEGKSSNRDESEHESKIKTRKPIIITKKRSENVDHKMPNTKVTSKLADYIKAPVPVKPKEEKEMELKKKQNKNVKNSSQKGMNVTEISNTKSKLNRSRASSVDGGNKMDENVEKTKSKKPEKPKPVIKREHPKSKWENIMSQIEANKDTAKPKPMSEIKSSLAAYLNTPLPQLPPADVDSNTDNASTQPRRELKSKLKQLPPPPPKIDFSKIKSKLNVPTAASAIKAMPKREHTPKTGKVKNDSRTSINKVTDDNRKMSEGSVVLMMHPITEGISSTKSSRTDLSIFENRGSNAGSQAKEGVTSKENLVDQSKRGDRRPSAHSLKSENSEKGKLTLDQVNKPIDTHKKVTQAPTNQTKKPRVFSTAKATTTTGNNNNAHIRSKSTTNSAHKEIERLESLCEARTKEVVHTKMQLKATTQAFDAMAVLVNYCSNELKAFECPVLAKKLDTMQKELDNYTSQIVNINSQKEEVDKNLTQIMQEKDEATQRTKETLDIMEKSREEHEKLTHDLNGTHSAALSKQREELSARQDETVQNLTQFYERQLELLRQAHERQIADITNDSKMEISSLKISHLEEVQELRNKHDDQMEELHEQHRNKLEVMTHQFESIKLSLSEKVVSLHKECDELARRARVSEDALQRDADVKVQIALAPYLNLPSEIESLKLVQEMRIEEIQRLRTKIMDLEKQLEEIPIAREKIISLQQKIENLGAIINIKTEHEKQLHEKCQVLMRKYDRESRANKRISMDYEQVMWRMSQSSEFGSCESLTKRQFSQSPAHGVEGPTDSNCLTVSHSGSHGNAVLQVTKQSGNSINEGDRKLRSRSATSVTEKNEGRTKSLSPQLKQKRRNNKCQVEEITVESETFDRMCYSAGPEIMSGLLSDSFSQQKQWRKQSENMELKDITGIQVTPASDMTNSYARSLSGISDSGVYDSMTRSCILDSSIVSTDSEWGTSINVSVTCDSTGSEHESGPASGYYHLQNNDSTIENKESSLETERGSMAHNNAKSYSS